MRDFWVYKNTTPKTLVAVIIEGREDSVTCFFDPVNYTTYNGPIASTNGDATTFTIGPRPGNGEQQPGAGHQGPGDVEWEIVGGVGAGDNTINVRPDADGKCPGNFGKFCVIVAASGPNPSLFEKRCFEIKNVRTVTVDGVKLCQLTLDRPVGGVIGNGTILPIAPRPLPGAPGGTPGGPVWDDPYYAGINSDPKDHVALF